MPRDRRWWLLLCGVVGPPVFFAVFTVAGAVRPGYSAMRNFVSELSIGDQGWQQIANFIVFGLLMLGFAGGARSALRSGPASVSGPILLAVFGAALVLAGVFVTDPGAEVTTFHGAMHIAVSVVVFAALAVACFVFARRYIRERGWRGFGLYSLVTGVAVPILLFLTGGPMTQSLGLTGVLQRVTIAVGWGWIVLLALRLRRHPASS